MGRLYKDIKKGLEEVVAYKKGKLTLKSELIEIPEPPEGYSPRKIKGIRTKSNYSQGVFAKILNVSIKTVQAWESGDRNPTHSALRLLEIIDQGYYPPQMHRKSL